MTRLAPTTREPACDIAAQFDALINPAHPKKAMWISVGTELPAIDPDFGLEWLRIDDAGILIAGELDCRRLARDPSEETLAAILGYVESKIAACALSHPAWPLVVQARCPIRDCVILEMVASYRHWGAAASRARIHGRVHLMTMEACLRRRSRLIAVEDRARLKDHAKKTEGFLAAAG